MMVALEFGIHVTVGDEYIRPPIVVVVEKPASPTQISQLRAKLGVEGSKGETPVTLVVVEVGNVVVKVRLKYVEPAVAVVVVRRDTHSCLRKPVFVKGDASLHAALRKGPVAIVAEEHAGGRITGHVNARPSTILKITRQHSQSVAVAGLGDPRSSRDVSKYAATL